MHALPVLILSLFAVQEPEQRQGVTVPIDRELEERFTDIHEFLEQGAEESAVALLQQILEADPAALVPTMDGDRMIGASAEAGRILAGLSQASQQQREEIIARYAETALADALQPPDRAALQDLALRYAGTAIGEQAQLALIDLAEDRGYSAPAEGPSSQLRSISVESLQDAELPLVEGQGLRPLWRYDFAQRPELLRRSHRMAFGDGVGYVSNGIEVVALRLGDGEVLWRFEGPIGWEAPIGETRMQALLEGVNEDMVTAPVLEDGVLVVVLQESEPIGRSDSFNRARGWSSIAVRRRLPARRVYAFDAETGRILWTSKADWLGNSESEPRGLVAAPPAIAEGRVIVPVYDAVGTIDLSLQCLDLYTGESLWKRFVVSGQQETNLFGNILSEMASQPPVADDGRVWFASNLGCIAAFEIETGRVLWSRLYPRTRVRVFQTGMPSVRQETFANLAPAYDGKRLVAAPRDSGTAFALEASTGKVIDIWPQFDGRYGELRNLIGVTRDGAWFHGTHLVFLPFPGSGKSMQVSDELYSRHGMPNIRYGAAFARGEILAPAVGSVDILDPFNLNRRARMQGLKGRTGEMGSIQVAPGLAFILRQNGISAYSSPDAILMSLAEESWTAETLEKLLPYLEGVDLSDPNTARSVAVRTAELADLAERVDLTERLRLVSARGRFMVGESEAALEQLDPVLSSRTRTRRVDAAELGLEVLERGNPAHPAMDRVLRILQNANSDWVRSVDGSRELKSVAVARARVLQHGKRAFGGDAHLDALFELLSLSDLASGRQGDLSLEAWARFQLENAQRDPSVARKVEARAKLAFDSEAPSESLMRRFAGTQTAWNWLLEQAQSVGTNRALALQLANWSRSYSWPDAQADHGLFPTEMIIGAEPLAKIPSSLEIRASYELMNRKRLLDMSMIGDELRVLVYDGTNAQLIRLQTDSLQEGSRFRVKSPKSTSASSGFGFVHAGGATMIHGARWVKIPVSGDEVVTLNLPGAATQDESIRFGKLIALLCERPDGGIELEVRDIETGVRILGMTVPLRSDRFHHLAWDGEHLLLFQEQSSQALRIPVLHRDDEELISLPSSPDTQELEQIIPLPDGLVLRYERRDEERLWVRRGDKQVSLAQRPRVELWTFRSANGFGWFQLPQVPSLEDGRGPVMAWQGFDQDEALAVDFAGQSLRFPQIDGYSDALRELGPGGVVTLEQTDEERLLIKQWRLPKNAAPSPGWRLEVDDIPFDRLVTHLPFPVSTTNGWLIPLKIRSSGGEAPRLVLLSVNNDGRLIDRLDLESSSNSTLRIQTVVGDSWIALRHDSEIHLIGVK